MKRALLVLPLLLAGCPSGPDDVPVLVDPDPSDDGCPAMFRQEILPDYHVEIADAEWAALQDEFIHRREREAAGMEPEPYHPVVLRYDDGSGSVEVPDVLLRLKGASSWLQTIDLDADPKMQFVLAFNEIDPEGRFLGVRKVELDMPRTDQTYLRQRLALAYLREAGLPAQCANSARVFINGDYYGLYTNLERMDKEFLQRHYGEEDEGDLWKGGRVIKTNEDTFSWDRIDAFWNLEDTATLEQLADMDAAVYEWAAEAVAGDADGYYNGRANFYLYDHPSRGFVWMPQDLDTVFDRDFLPVESSPVFPSCVARWERDWHHYLLFMNEPAQLERYVAALADARDRYDVASMQSRIEQWSAQVARPGEDDPHRPFTMEAHDLALSFMHAYPAERSAYIDGWLACRQDGGPDGDGDGVDACHDCDDADPAVRPGAVETCNLRDDDCDGRIDNVPAATCS